MKRNLFLGKVNEVCRLISLGLIVSIMSATSWAEASSPSQLNVDQDKVNLTPPIKGSNTSNQQTLTITNISQQTLHHLTTQAQGLQGVTLSGCQGQLQADHSCKLAIHASSHVSGAGYIKVAAPGTAPLKMTATTKTPFLLSSFSTALKPSSQVMGVLITNPTDAIADIKANDVHVASGDKQHISVDQGNAHVDRAGYQSCYSSHFKRYDTIKLPSHKSCLIPIQVKQGAQGKAQIAVPGNFDQTQYIPINIAPALVQLSKNSNKGTTQLKVNVSRDNQNDLSQFAINRLVADFTSGSRQTIQHLQHHDQRSLIFNPPKQVGLLQLAGDHLSDNVMPMLVNASTTNNSSDSSRLWINNIERSDLPANLQTQGYSVLRLQGKAIHGVQIHVNNVTVEAPGPVDQSSQYAGDTPTACENALNNSGDQQCTIWLKPSLKKLGKQRAQLTVDYQDEFGLNHTRTVQLATENDLIASGVFQLPVTTQAMSIQNAGSHVGNSTLMRWNGRSWRWQQASKTAFDQIGQVAINKRKQLCVNAKKASGFTFACFNGYRWLVNNQGLPDKHYMWRLLAVPSNSSAFGDDLAGGLVALMYDGAQRKKLYYLPADANNGSSASDKTAWQSVNISSEHVLDNVIAGKDNLYATVDASDNVIKLVQIHLTINHGSATVHLNQVGNSIRAKSSRAYKHELLGSRHHYPMAFQMEHGKKAIYVGGVVNNKPVIYKNKQNDQGEWQNWQAISLSKAYGDIASIKVSNHSDDSIVVSVVNPLGTQAKIYRYDSHDLRWYQVGHAMDPTLSIHMESQDKQMYLGAAQFNLGYQPKLKTNPINSSTILHASYSQNWSGIGGLQTQQGMIRHLTVMPYIQITGYKSQ